VRTIDHCVRPGRIVLVEPQACDEGEKGGQSLAVRSLGQSRSADDVWLDWPTAHR
jgi:hypothetical protein